MEQPITDLVVRYGPHVLVAAAAALAYLAGLAADHAESRRRVRAFLTFRDRVLRLERHRPSGLAPSPGLAAARARLERLRGELVRDGLLSDRAP